MVAILIPGVFKMASRVNPSLAINRVFRAFRVFYRRRGISTGEREFSRLFHPVFPPPVHS